MKKFFLLFVLIITTVCALTAIPLIETQSSATPEVVETVSQPTVIVEATAMKIPVNHYAVFSINVQDFSYPAESAAAVDKIITLHETYHVPVDIYLTDVMAKIYAEQYPQLLEKIKNFASGCDFVSLSRATPVCQSL